jgi:hypothetical protein
MTFLINKVTVGDRGRAHAESLGDPPRLPWGSETGTGRSHEASSCMQADAGNSKAIQRLIAKTQQIHLADRKRCRTWTSGSTIY